MKGKLYYIGVGLLLSLVSCSSDTGPEPLYTVGEADNPIRLSVGIGGSVHQATTRSITYSALSEGTAIILRVDGKWKGKDQENISKSTTATAADPGSNTFNVLSLNPMLYWDDYGTADPNNKTNRDNGLIIYGVAVDGETTPVAVDSEGATVPDDGNWTNYQWQIVDSPSAEDEVKEVLKKDLLVGKLQLKFDDRNSSDKNYIALNHVLSKVSVVLKAGVGFDGGQFTSDPAIKPTVTLSGNKGAESGNEYAFTQGTINLKTCEVTSSSEKKTLTAAVAWTGGGSSPYSEATATALLFPKSDFAADDNNILAKVNAYGNIYYIRAKELREAIALNSNHMNGSDVDYKTRSGFHYVINVIVNKSDIQVSASIKDWETINSDEETPKVSVNVPTGSSTSTPMLGDQFDLYYSVSKTGSFSETNMRTLTKSGESWNMNTPVYWPDHNTHYFFRGITTLTADNNSSSVDVSHWNMTDGNPYVEVENGKYEQYTYPSNLLMGKPITGEQMCGSIDHTPVDMEESGICARQGAIALTFQYMMSQVEVELKSDASTESQKVHLDKDTKVEIINGYQSGKVYLGTMSVHVENKQDYSLNGVEGEGKALYRHSIIVPQALDDIQFKVTVYKKDSSPLAIDDVYYLKIKDTKKTDGSLVAPNGKWESGMHYVYTLNILKTGISAVATLQDWTKVVSGDEDIWL